MAEEDFEQKMEDVIVDENERIEAERELEEEIK